MRFDAITRAAEGCRVCGYASPIAFAERDVSFRFDASARQMSVDLSLTPYLRDILAQWDFRGHGSREIVIMAVEQTGKSLSWQLGLLWSFLYEPCLSLAVYPSDDKCDEVNRSKILPLIEGVPALAPSIALPRAKARNRYHLPGVVSYFQGAGERISAHPARIRIADEVDDWGEIEAKAVSRKLDDLRKRGRTFDDSLLVIVSSPKGESPMIAGEFAATSRGYWHLRCLECGDLTMRSCDVAGRRTDSGEIRGGLQFETTQDAKGRHHLIRGTERMICPACLHQHEYCHAAAMNRDGGYIHEVPELIGRRTGYQWGALASQWQSLSWSFVAERALLAGRSGDIRDQANYDNSIRGLPFRPRPKTRTGEDRRELLEKHCAPLPDPELLEAVFLAADTQDNGWRWELRGLGTDSNRYLLAWGNAEYLTLDDAERARLATQGKEPGRTLAEVMAEGWEGIPVTMALIDEGGHRKPEVDAFVTATSRAFAYKGGWQGGIDQRNPWTWSKNQPKLVLARRADYQDRLLWYLHEQRDTANNYWFLPPREALTDEYLDELLAFQENPKKREGHLRRNWEHGGRRHDYFDVGLIYLVLEDVAVECLPPTEWHHGLCDLLTARPVDDAPNGEGATDAEEAPARAKTTWVQAYRQ